MIIKSSNRETPEKQIVKTDQNGNEETKGEMEIMLPDNEVYKFIEIQPIETIFREQVSYLIFRTGLQGSTDRQVDPRRRAAGLSGRIE